MNIIVTTFPKSGSNWIVNLLGDALGLRKVDLYDALNEQSRYDLSKHPWYKGHGRPSLDGSCVIKSHELPRSVLLKVSGPLVHLVRDGRDVAVSRYFYERDFCVANNLRDRFDEPFDDYVERVAGEWNDYVLAWLEETPRFFRYEDFLRGTVTILRAAIEHVGAQADDAAINQAIAGNTREKMRQSLDEAFKHNTFVRKGIAGDWKNHFSLEDARRFKARAGHALMRLGYEFNLDW